MQKQQEYLEDMTEVYRSSPRMPYTNSIDEPLVLSRDIPEREWVNTRFYREWVKPQGIKESLQTIVLQGPARLGVFTANRHEFVGVATDREIAVLRLLAPHIQRAVTIADVIDLKSLEAQALSATLDKIQRRGGGGRRGQPHSPCQPCGSRHVCRRRPGPLGQRTACYQE